MHPFEAQLVVESTDIELTLTAFQAESWLDFWLNPRRLRGSDFLMRWSQGQWSEERLIDAVDKTRQLFAIPYGPSSVAPSDDVRAFELYFERLEAAGLGKVKKPDLLIFNAEDRKRVDALLKELGGKEELPFISESNHDLHKLIHLARLAVECENSLWRAEKMPAFGVPLTPQRRMGGKLGLKKSAVLPTIIIKDEDRAPLRAWQRNNRVPLHVWHVFFDRAYGLAFDEAERLIRRGLTEPTEQVFQAPGGATTRKIIYKHYYHHGYKLGMAEAEPQLIPAFIEDKNGHILPYVKFKGGSLKLSQQALDRLAGSL
ncbi:MAG: AccI family restriction endonuclease [Gammaproteobacteria bacterium]